MKNLTQFIIESLKIFEGGNAVTANPIPAKIAPKVYKEVETALLKYDNSLKLAPLGSLGKKKDDDFNGDIDIAIEITRPELEEIIKNVFDGYEVNWKTMGDIISISYPYNIDGYSGNAQVDFMIVKNLEWAKWRFDSPNLKTGESKYKAAAKVRLLAIIVAEIPVTDENVEYFDDNVTIRKAYKYTFNNDGIVKQLLDYTGKKGPLKNPKKIKEFEKFISNNPKEVMKFIFGDNAKESDFKSAESLWKAIHDPNKFKYQDVVPKIKERFYKEVIDADSSLKIDKNDFI